MQVTSYKQACIRRGAMIFLSCFLSLVSVVPAHAERVKDMASVAGVRSNQLVGYGLVVGLDGTGDQTSQTPFTVQSIKNMLNQFGITVPPNVNPQLKNVAAVSVSATLPPFAKPGQTIDVTVSSIGNAKSLRGGSLLMAPLRGADGQVYAIAQGNLVVGGLTAGGNDGSKVTVNIPSVGRVPNGATVERTVDNPFMASDSVVLNLRAADFTTANRLAESINKTMGEGTAQPLDATSVRVNAPRDAAQRVAYVSMLENLEVEPGEAPARVIVNSRTGTVVIGSHVRVMPAAVAHGSLTVTSALHNEIRAGLVVKPVCFNQDVKALVPTPEIFPKFLTYSLLGRADDLLKLVSTAGNSAGVLDTKLVQAFEIFLPGLHEQRAIAEALSDVDGLIAALDKLIAKKRAIKQAAMQQLLTGKTRLPGFSGEWETKRLGEIGRFRGGNGFPTKYQGGAAGDYPFFKVSDMNNEGNETFMQVANNYISETVRKQLGATAFPANSIVFAKVGAAVFLERKKILAKPSCIDNNMAAFTLDNASTNHRFIHYVLLNMKLGDLVTTTALPSLSGRVLSAIEIRLPAVPEQTAISTVLSDMDAEIAALEARRDKTRAIKQGMMQQLLTGRIRLI